MLIIYEKRNKRHGKHVSKKKRVHNSMYANDSISSLWESSTPIRALTEAKRVVLINGRPSQKGIWMFIPGSRYCFERTKSIMWICCFVGQVPIRMLSGFGS